MRRSRFAEGEIVHLLAEADNGVSIPEICRAADVSPRTFYRWRRRFGGLSLRDVNRMNELEGENRRLKALVAHFTARLASQSDADATGRPVPLPALRSDVGSDDAHAGMQPLRRPVATVVGRFPNLRTGR
ncbi:transposase [Chelatococcus sp. GCM10030263]|uniref:transposase n=1 Tax=Chelatococcus sp. GCM10030263 TaxID=3273387 RepID=UPI00360D3885